MPTPAKPKIYHIVHVDRLPSIIADEWLWSDSEMAYRTSAGTAIGMSRIKERRLEELTLASHPDLHVGDCVPFYFCPRSVMLYMINEANHPELTFRGGQGPIIHLEADLLDTVSWAQRQNQRWAFTLSNAGSSYFEDRCDLAQLGDIDWGVVQAKYWQNQMDRKQAEFLLEYRFPWSLATRIGVRSRKTHDRVMKCLNAATHKPVVDIIPSWYY